MCQRAAVRFRPLVRRAPVPDGPRGGRGHFGAPAKLAHREGLKCREATTEVFQGMTVAGDVRWPGRVEVQVGGDSDAGHSVALVARSPPTPSSSRGPGCPGRERLTRGGFGLRASVLAIDLAPSLAR